MGRALPSYPMLALCLRLCASTQQVIDKPSEISPAMLLSEARLVWFSKKKFMKVNWKGRLLVKKQIP